MWFNQLNHYEDNLTEKYINEIKNNNNKINRKNFLTQLIAW
jgi:hypothetical protein